MEMATVFLLEAGRTICMFIVQVPASTISWIWMAITRCNLHMNYPRNNNKRRLIREQRREIQIQMHAQ